MVLTGAAEARGRWTPGDDSLGREIPSGVDIHRAAGRPAPPRWQARTERWMGFHSPCSAGGPRVGRARPRVRGRRRPLYLDVPLLVGAGGFAAQPGARSALDRRPRRSVGAGRDEDLPHQAPPPLGAAPDAPDALHRRCDRDHHLRGRPQAATGVPRARRPADRLHPLRLRPGDFAGPEPTSRPRLPDRPHRLPAHRPRPAAATASLPAACSAAAPPASTSSPAPTSSCSRRSSG